MLKNVIQGRLKNEVQHLKTPLPAVLRILSLVLFAFATKDALAAKCLVNGQWYDYSGPECSSGKSSSESRGLEASQSHSDRKADVAPEETVTAGTISIKKCQMLTAVVIFGFQSKSQ
jgi:hypothetical protein